MFKALIWAGFMLLCTTAGAADYSIAGGATPRGGGVLDLRAETSDANADAYLTAGVLVTGAYTTRGIRVDANGGPYFQATAGDRLRAGVGLIVLANTSPVHGSRVNAILTAGVYGKRWRVYWLHVSNAGLKRPNYGYDAVLLGVSW
jgi:Lipid A 3-O-deacylase (PagL)